MTWLARLSDTYDQLADSEEEKLIPVNHIRQKGHINIVVSEEGEFRDAMLPEIPSQICLPATASSAGRTSKNVPHGLADKLKNVAGDYEINSGGKKGSFDLYFQQLEDWCESDWSHPCVRAILSYVSKKSVIQDLVDIGIILLSEEDNKLAENLNQEQDKPPLFRSLTPKAGKFDQGDALVYWSVEHPEYPITKTWLNDELYDSWTKFCESKSANYEICYVSGNYQPVVFNHPKGIRRSGDNAKLISSNDWDGFTFRGKFTDKNNQNRLQAVNIGETTSQKAHNALKWLIANKSFKYEDQAVVTWTVSGKKIPHPHLDNDLLNFGDYDEQAGDVDNGAGGRKISPGQTTDFGQAYSDQLNRYMTRYGSDLTYSDIVSIMVVDSASPGRMAVSYFREFRPNDYLDRISKWYKDFAWWCRYTRFDENQSRSILTITTPTPNRIFNAVYGDSLENQSSLKKNFYLRLLPAIVEGAAVPWDIVSMAINNARNPKSKEHWVRTNTLSVACSLFRGYYIRHPQKTRKKEFPMSLNRESRSRDYLYGRLLAIAERTEEMALFIANMSRPTTTVDQLMFRFSERPFATWPLIYRQLTQNMQQLQISRAGFLNNMKKELDSVMDNFDDDEFKSDDKLSGEFLLGYHAERLYLMNQNNTNLGENDGDISTVNED